MFLRSTLLSAIVTGLLLVGCGGSGSGSNTTPIDPFPPVTQKFSELPHGSFSLALKRTGTGTLPGDANIYVQIVSLTCKNNLPCTNGETPEVIYVARNPVVTVTGGPNGNASLGEIRTGTPGQNIPSFKLADLVNGNITLPGNVFYAGTRVYISMGKALTQEVNQAGDGYIQTDFGNPTNDNIAIPFDFVEFTYYAKPNSLNPSENTVSFGGNLTQVDQFGIPLAMTIKGVAGTTVSRGITLGAGSSSGASSRDEIINAYLNTVGTKFQGLTQPATAPFARILSPFHVASFQSGGANATFFDDYIDAVWNHYRDNPSDIYSEPGSKGNKYHVSGNGTVLDIIQNGVPIGSLTKPTTLEVFENNGPALQPGGGSDAAKGLRAFGAIMAASLNRHIATQPLNMSDPTQYYLTSAKNEYAQFWHSISIDGLAYGLAFDDVYSQGSLGSLKLTENIANLNVEVGW